jgi:hypothetical protein
LLVALRPRQGPWLQRKLRWETKIYKTYLWSGPRPAKSHTNSPWSRTNHQRLLSSTLQKAQKKYKKQFPKKYFLWFFFVDFFLCFFWFFYWFVFLIFFCGFFLCFFNFFLVIFFVLANAHNVYGRSLVASRGISWHLVASPAKPPSSVASAGQPAHWVPWVADAKPPPSAGMGRPLPRQQHDVGCLAKTCSGMKGLTLRLVTCATWTDALQKHLRGVARGTSWGTSWHHGHKF